MTTDESDDDLVIDSSNFSEYFFDVRQHRPQAGQIMAKYTAVADFVASDAKRNVMTLLRMEGKAHSAAMVMRKIHGAKEPDCYRVCREMAQDMLIMTDEDVLQRPYTMVIEFFFYTQRKYVPKNDPHWQTIDLLKYDSESRTLKSEIHL